jgi:hypothetical protein
MIRFQRCALALLAAGMPLMAGQTRVWSQGDAADYDKAVLKHLALRSDGVLSLSPESRELYDTSSPYLWAIARDSKGNLYAGGGTPAKIFRMTPNGEHKVLAEFDALEVHAIAIDRNDAVFAATSPDGKVYRVPANGKPEVFFDPKAKYIWGLAFNREGDLFVATGDRGEVYKVAPSGKGAVFFKSEETHAQSIAVDGQGNVIIGTEPGGLVIRITPAGAGFVLYQMGKKEVTAVATAPDGTIYAAAAGNKGAPAPPPASPPAQVPIAGQPAPAARPPAPPPTAFGGPAQSVPGGSEVYRIDPTGFPQRVWSHARDVVYALAVDAQGHLLVGTGNKGALYRVESPTQFSTLLSLPCTQVTAFHIAGGSLYAVTGNVGKVYQIGPALEREGTVESDVFDSGIFSAWGRLSFEGKLNGGRIAVATRSGNLDQPQKNWSAWSAPVTENKGGPASSPASRFVQWRATLTSAGGGASPTLESVDVAYLPKNIAPRVEEIEITPVNYRFPAPAAVTLVAPSVTLPPMGKRRDSSLVLDTSSTPSLTYVRGMIGARWSASDPNGDTLIFTVHIRGPKETEWKLLREKVRERYLSWDATAFPDGDYQLRVTASDLPGNPPADALSGELESNPFTIDNTPPRISNLSAVRSSTRLQVKWHAADALNHIKKAEYSLDGGDWTVATPVTRLSDSMELDYDLGIENVAPGEHTIAVRVEDDYDNPAVEKVVVR